MSKVNFSNADTTVKVAHKKQMKSFLKTVFIKENKKLLDLQFVFCSDEYLLQINRSFLHHDDFTDIITFDLTEKSEEGIVGEIYISIDRVKENALIHQTSFLKETHRVVLHGVLHLCGYNDKKKSEITIMRQKEDNYLRLFEEYLNQN